MMIDERHNEIYYTAEEELELERLDKIRGRCDTCKYSEKDGEYGEYLCTFGLKERKKRRNYCAHWREQDDD
jgi:hypothetical protein